MRNNTRFKKIPSACYTSFSFKNRTKIAQTINYTTKDENEKNLKENRPKIFKEKNKINCLKTLKKKFFSSNLILKKPFCFRSGKTINNNNITKKHKNTFSDIQSFGSYFTYNSSNNSNTTANTHNNSNKKCNSNSLQKYSNLYKINLKTLSRKNSMKKNYTKKNICPIKYSNRNQNKKIKEENKTNNNNSNNNKNGEISNISLNIKSSNYNINSEEDNIKRYNNIKYSEEYINDILDNLLKEEKEMKIIIDSNYFSFQSEINDKMRAILIDWLIDVHMRFNFKEETLFITIYIIDCYLSLKKIERCNLQLLGVTALFIACKQNEIIFRRLKEYAYITDNAYTESEITNMEEIILKTLNFNILFPSALSFYEIISNKLGFINDSEKFNLGEFLMQSFYMSANCLKYSSSTIACSTSYIVMKFFKMKNYQYCYNSKIFNIKNNKEMTEHLKQKNNNPVNIIKECAKDICYFISELSKNNLKASIRKFSNKKFENVSELIFGSLLKSE